jgi:hypothetical protein
MAAYVPAASVTKLTALDDIDDRASKSDIPPPVGLVHGHDGQPTESSKLACDGKAARGYYKEQNRIVLF